MVCEAVEKPPLVAEGLPGAGFVVFAKAIVGFVHARGLGGRGRAGEVEDRVAARDTVIRESTCVDSNLDQATVLSRFCFDIGDLCSMTIGSATFVKYQSETRVAMSRAALELPP